MALTLMTWAGRAGWWKLELLAIGWCDSAFARRVGIALRPDGIHFEHPLANGTS